MGPSDLHFGQLLFLLNNEVLKLKIRSIEKNNKRVVNTKNGIHFNYIFFFVFVFVQFSEQLWLFNGQGYIFFLQNFGYIPLFKQVCITFIPLFRWTHFSASFCTSRKINLKLYTLDKKGILKQFIYTNLFLTVSTGCHLQEAHIYS